MTTKPALPSRSGLDLARALTPSQTRHFRPDIEGMRAVAVGLVILGHAGVPVLPAGFVGVDVFFVISGFLITGLLLRELEQHGRISLMDFYSRRAKRVLPAACVVLLASLALTALFLPRSRWEASGWGVLAGALYVMNWLMAANSVDYGSVNSAPSITQQYWSLSVEEQFYLIWPVLLIALGWIAGRRGGGHRRLYLAGLTLIAVPSFACAVVLSPHSASAYYLTTTRMWELALGGALAVTGAWFERIPRSHAVLTAWLGLVAVIGSAVMIRSGVAFPGWNALAPTLGTAAVIAGGPSAGRHGPVALLARPSMLVVGALSYSLYLWHWPVIIAAQAFWGDLNVGTALVAVALASIFALLTYRYVENPVRRATYFSFHPRSALRMGLLCTIATALAALLFELSMWPQPPVASMAATEVNPGPSATAPVVPSHPGAAALAPDPRSSPAGAVVVQVGTIRPDPVAAKDDTPKNYNRRTCMVEGADNAEPIYCRFGDPDAPIKLALVGDSHADHWIPAFRRAAEGNGWRLTVATKGGCPFIGAQIVIDGRPSESCSQWNATVKADLLGAGRPDVLVVTHSSYPLVGDDPSDVQSSMVREMRAVWGEMDDAGIPVLVLRDTPIQEVDVADCVSAVPDNLSACATPRDLAQSRGGGPAQEEAVRDMPGVRLIDLNDWVCPTDSCPPVIGGVLVWRDRHHLTATYSASLAPALNLQLKPAVEGLLSGG